MDPSQINHPDKTSWFYLTHFKLLLLSIIFFILSACAPSPMHVFTPFDLHKKGEYRFIQDKDNTPQLNHPGPFFELWWFDAQTKDGLMVVVNFHLGFLVNGLGNDPFLEVMVYVPGQSPIYEKQVFSWDDFSSDPFQLDISLGPHRISGTYPTYSLYCKTKRLILDLTFEAAFKSGRMEPDTIDFGNNQYLGWLVPIPRANVYGKITIDQKSFDIKGYGYHDHAWGNISITKTLTGWDWFRFHNKEFTMMFANYRLTDAYDRNNIPLLMVFYKNQPLIITDQVVVRYLGTSHIKQMHHALPCALEIQVLEPGFEGGIIITPMELVHYHDFLSNRSWFVRTMARIFYGYPEGIRFRSNVEMDMTTPKGRIRTFGENALQERLYLK